MRLTILVLFHHSSKVVKPMPYRFSNGFNFRSHRLPGGFSDGLKRAQPIAQVSDRSGLAFAEPPCVVPDTV